MVGGRQALGAFRGALLRQKRNEAEMTQGALARASGVSVQSIKAYETGVRQPQAHTALKLAKALNVALPALVEEHADLPPGLMQLRLAAGLTQEQVAARAGVGRAWYGRFESGAAPFVRPEVIGELAKVYGVDAQQVLNAHAVSRRLFVAKRSGTAPDAASPDDL